jgi:branched-chain amino acid transport system substrate-binding protein
MRMSIRLILLLGVVLALVGTACGDADDTGTTTADTTATTVSGDTTTATTAPTAATTTAAPEEEKPPIVVGLITDVSGRFVSFGKDIEAATNLSVDKVNADGGINGSMLQVTLIDTGGEPDQAVLAYRQLADDGAFAVSGPLSSGEGEVLFAQAPTVALPVITGTANKEGITDLGQGWAFRNTATNTALFTEAMPQWATAYGVETAVLVFDEEEPVTAAAAMFAIPGVAEAVGINIVNADAPITFTRGQTDFSTTVQRIADTEADGLIIMSAPAEAGLIARELARQGETRPVLGHPAQGGSTFFEQGGDEINDWVLPSIFNPASDNPLTQEYLTGIAELDAEPPTVPEAANYYDNILMLAEVFRAAGIDGNSTPDDARAAVQEGLLALCGFQGVAGEICFLPNGDADKTVYVNVVIGGELQPLE